jgi:hypothetical protein
MTPSKSTDGNPVKIADIGTLRLNLRLALSDLNVTLHRNTVKALARRLYEHLNYEHLNEDI